MDPTRIADLRRRLQADPTSIAFAQLAEEHRRAGQLGDAVEVCREGLLRHTGYLSARITLGRALAELGQATEAEREFDYVLRSAPDNLAAIRGLAEIHQKHGHLERALTYYRRALALAHYDPDLDETAQAIARELGDGHRAVDPHGLSFEQARRELLEAPSRVPAPAAAARVDFDAILKSLGHEPDAPAPPIVEAWLAHPPAIPLPAIETPAVEAAAPDLGDAPTPSSATSSSDADLGDELLARIEQELRQLERQPPPSLTARDRDTTPALSPADRLVVAELERWLAAIDGRRRTLAAHA